MSLGVRDVIVNTGQLPKVTGFQNARLPASLGVVNEGAGLAFRYAFQVTFELDGIAAADVSPFRTVEMKTHWTDPIAAKFATPAPNVRAANPAKNDDPNSQNVVRSTDSLTVMDAPGPSNPIVLKDDKHYPITFEGKFRLYLRHTPSNLEIASLIYYIRTNKPTKSGTVTGQFDIMEIKWASMLATVTHNPGELPSAPTYTILGWMSRAL